MCGRNDRREDLENGTIYALSNNHVFARENAASLGETIYQPGRYDLNCGSGSQYAWATLAFSGRSVSSATTRLTSRWQDVNIATHLSSVHTAGRLWGTKLHHDDGNAQHGCPEIRQDDRTHDRSGNGRERHGPGAIQ